MSQCNHEQWSSDTATTEPTIFRGSLSLATHMMPRLMCWLLHSEISGTISLKKHNSYLSNDRVIYFTPTDDSLPMHWPDCTPQSTFICARSLKPIPRSCCNYRYHSFSTPTRATALASLVCLWVSQGFKFLVAFTKLEQMLSLNSSQASKWVPFPMFLILSQPLVAIVYMCHQMWAL